MGFCWGYNPLILTFDPNFLGHPPSCRQRLEHGSPLKVETLVGSLVRWFASAGGRDFIPEVRGENNKST